MKPDSRMGVAVRHAGRVMARYAEYERWLERMKKTMGRGSAIPHMRRRGYWLPVKAGESCAYLAVRISLLELQVGNLGEAQCQVKVPIDIYPLDPQKGDAFLSGDFNVRQVSAAPTQEQHQVRREIRTALLQGLERSYERGSGRLGLSIGTRVDFGEVPEIVGGIFNVLDDMIYSPDGGPASCSSGCKWVLAEGGEQYRLEWDVPPKNMLWDDI